MAKKHTQKVVGAVNWRILEIVHDLLSGIMGFLNRDAFPSDKLPTVPSVKEIARKC